jgi:DNA-binding transcriptional ArsR family regulator
MEVNVVGDLVLTDPSAMRALADPFRLALHDELRRRGPATAGELAGLTGSTPQAIHEHLDELATAGLVERHDQRADAEESRWSAVGKGFVFEIPADPDGQSAARQLSNAMFLNYVDLPRGWVAYDEPRLGLEWARAAGLLNARMVITPNELRSLQDALEQLLEPFLTREPGATPAEARQVRVLSYFMPEADEREQR